LAAASLKTSPLPRQDTVTSRQSLAGGGVGVGAEKQSPFFRKLLTRRHAAPPPRPVKRSTVVWHPRDPWSAVDVVRLASGADSTAQPKERPGRVSPVEEGPEAVAEGPTEQGKSQSRAAE